MAPEVQLIADGAQLARSLLAATVTVLLLSSPFSSETGSALRTISHAASLTTCPSVQYVHFTLRPGEIVEQPRRWFSFTGAATAASAVTNLTAFPPLFPFVRVFHARETPYVREFRGSFDAFVLARFISDACGVDLDFPRVVSRDEFALAVRRNAFGALMIVPMPHGQLHSTHRQLAFALSDAVTNSSSPWVLSLVHSQKDELFARRVGDQSLLFVHLPYDKAVVHHLSRVSPHDVSSLMRQFEQRPIRTVVRDTTLVRPKQLSYFDAVSTAQAMLRFPCSYISLSAFLNADYSAAPTQPAVLWLVVIQTWCAYCQRIMPVYEQFARIVSASDADVHVLFEEELDVLPRFLDRLVDGYPTVLRLQQFNGVFQVYEYVGWHELDALIDEHLKEQTDKLLSTKRTL